MSIPPPIGLGALHRVSDLVFARDVGAVEASAIDAVRDRRARRVSIHDGNPRTFLGKKLGGGFADSGGAAGDDSDLVVHAPGHSTPDRFIALRASFSASLSACALGRRRSSSNRG